MSCNYPFYLMSIYIYGKIIICNNSDPMCLLPFISYLKVFVPMLYPSYLSSFSMFGLFKHMILDYLSIKLWLNGNTTSFEHPIQPILDYWQGSVSCGESSLSACYGPSLMTSSVYNRVGW